VILVAFSPLFHTLLRFEFEGRIDLVFTFKFVALPLDPTLFYYIFVSVGSGQVVPENSETEKRFCASSHPTIEPIVRVHVHVPIDHRLVRFLVAFVSKSFKNRKRKERKNELEI